MIIILHNDNKNINDIIEKNNNDNDDHNNNGTS